jgi:hypothetical protein
MRQLLLKIQIHFFKTSSATEVRFLYAITEVLTVFSLICLVNTYILLSVHYNVETNPLETTQFV